MDIPWEKLNAATLKGVIEDFVLREGTDYGTSSFSLEQKIEHVVTQLKKGKAKIVYDKDSGTCNIITSLTGMST